MSKKCVELGTLAQLLPKKTFSLLVTVHIVEALMPLRRLGGGGGGGELQYLYGQHVTGLSGYTVP